MPYPPPIPDLEVTSGPSKISIKWGYPNDNYFKDVDTGVDDFFEWILYRKVGAYLVDDPSDVNKYNKYEFLGGFPKSTTSYEDKNIIMGVQYYYCVTSVDDGSQNKTGLFPGQKLESSYYKNRTLFGAAGFKAGRDVSSEVLIVPNPYSLSTGLTNAMNRPGAPHSIQFKNLLAYCTLKIYTVTGDLIKTINHTSGSGDEAWSGLRTDYNQYPASGVYILAVYDAKDTNKNPLPKAFFKFVIVR